MKNDRKRFQWTWKEKSYDLFMVLIAVGAYHGFPQFYNYIVIGLLILLITRINRISEYLNERDKPEELKED